LDRLELYADMMGDAIDRDALLDMYKVNSYLVKHKVELGLKSTRVDKEKFSQWMT